VFDQMSAKAVSEDIFEGPAHACHGVRWPCRTNPVLRRGFSRCSCACIMGLGRIRAPVIDHKARADIHELCRRFSHFGRTGRRPKPRLCPMRACGMSFPQQAPNASSDQRR
jgi:hypothetical protein